MRFYKHALGLVLASAPALLQAANPHILIKDPTGTPTVVTSNSFTFGADGSGGGVFLFQNESGDFWRSLSVSAVLPAGEQITVTPGPFNSDTIVETPSTGNNVLYQIIFGPTSTGGVPNTGIFSINLNNAGTDPNGSGEWGPGTDFNGQANVTVSPEPSTISLLLLGFCAAGFAAYRRRSSLG